MAFPPIVDGILVGSANVAVLALLVVPARRLGPLASFLKIYALLPMVGERRWRDVAVTLGLLAATAIILPWSSWFAQLDTINANLARTSSTTSVFGHPVLMAIAGRRPAFTWTSPRRVVGGSLAMAPHAVALCGDFRPRADTVPCAGMVLSEPRSMGGSYRCPGGLRASGADQPLQSTTPGPIYDRVSHNSERSRVLNWKAQGPSQNARPSDALEGKHVVVRLLSQ